MMMIAASLIWAGAAEKPEQSKMSFKNHQNDSKQLSSRFDQNQIKNTKAKKTAVRRLWSVRWVG